MSSPFSTFEEFEGAIDGPTEGAIYTFAHSPAVNAIALLICVGLFLWFLVRTFSTHYDVPAVDKSLNHLSALIVAGLLSLAGVEYRQTTQPHQPAEVQASSLGQRQQALPTVGLLTLGLIGLPMGQRTRRKRIYRANLSKR
jgi:hypothetical protein